MVREGSRTGEHLRDVPALANPRSRHRETCAGVRAARLKPADPRRQMGPMPPGHTLFRLDVRSGLRLVFRATATRRDDAQAQAQGT